MQTTEKMSVILFLISSIVILLTLLSFHIKQKLNYWQRQRILHEEPNFLSGSFQGLRKTRSMAEIFNHHYQKFKGTGPFCGFYLLHRPGVVVLDPELLKNILIKDFANFTDRGLYHNEEDDPLSGRLFMLDGVKWKNMRNKLSPTFSSGRMKAMFPLVLEQVDQLVEMLSDLSAQNSCLELKDIMARFTTDVIGSCAFGLKCNSLINPQAVFRVMGLRSLNERKHGQLVTSFMQGYPDWARKLHMCTTPNDINSFFIRIVKEVIDFRKEKNIQSNEFLGILTSKKNDSEEQLSIEQMAAQAFVFFLGGFETSSSTLGFALHELALQSEIQEKLREEIRASFLNGKIEYEALHELKYMGQVISETLRKYPIVPLITRLTLKDYKVSGHENYIIKQGMPVFIPIYGFHHDAEFYPEPETFNPNRFNLSNNINQPWLAFGEGPRNCIGLRFALMQIRVALAYLLINFNFSVCPQTDIPLNLDKTSVLLSAKNGIYLKVEKLNPPPS